MGEEKPKKCPDCGVEFFSEYSDKCFTCREHNWGYECEYD